MPLHGAYVKGGFWYFVILNEKEYSVSKAFDATENDIYKIFYILCKDKEYINDWFDRQIQEKGGMINLPIHTFYLP